MNVTARPVRAAAVVLLLVLVALTVTISLSPRRPLSASPAVAHLTLAVLDDHRAPGSAAEDNERYERITQCSRKTPGRFWNPATSTCDPLPGWIAPLKPFETSVDELACENNREGWTAPPPSPFYPGMQPLGSSATKGGSWATRVARHNFLFHSSWLFHQWLPWERVVGDDPENLRNNDTGRYRAYHDPNASNLYRLENFCVSAYEGLSGYNIERKDEWKGKGDTRDIAHNEQVFAGYLRNVTSLLVRPDEFDERPTLLVSLNPQSRSNLAHTTLRVLSLMGFLQPDVAASAFGAGAWSWADEPEWAAASAAAGAAPAETVAPSPVSGGRTAKPLIIWMWQNSAQGHSATAFFYRVLGLPWAGVFEPGVTPEYVQTAFRNYGRTTYDRTGWNNSRVCFRRGVVWQNCHTCEWYDPTTETEPYSFGMFTEVAGSWRRQRVFNMYRARFDTCLPTFAHANVEKERLRLLPPPESSSALRLPSVFFDVRSAHRGILDLTAFLPLLRERLAPFVSDIILREPWRGSRAQYVDELRNADVFVGAHGGAFSHVSLLPRGSVVVEFSARVHMCKANSIPPYSHTKPFDDAVCWFGPFSRALGNPHWGVAVHRWGAGHRIVTPSFLVENIAQAACRWLWMRRNLSGGKEHEPCVPLYRRGWQEWDARTMQWMTATIPEDAPNAEARQAQDLQDLFYIFGAGMVLSDAAATSLLLRLKPLHVMTETERPRGGWTTKYRVEAFPLAVWRHVLQHWATEDLGFAELNVTKYLRSQVWCTTPSFAVRGGQVRGGSGAPWCVRVVQCGNVTTQAASNFLEDTAAVFAGRWRRGPADTARPTRPTEPVVEPCGL